MNLGPDFYITNFDFDGTTAGRPESICVNDEPPLRGYFYNPADSAVVEQSKQATRCDGSAGSSIVFTAQ